MRLRFCSQLAGSRCHYKVRSVFANVACFVFVSGTGEK